MIRLDRLCLSGALLLLAAGLAGCEPKGTQVNPVNRNPDPPASVDAAHLPAFFPHAVDLRVHPATRYVQEAGELRLEARIELLDQFNEPIKDVGVFAIELKTLNEEGLLVVGEGDRRDYQWNFEISTRQAQADYWDPIARSYILPLQLDERDTDLPGRRTVLLVTFQPAWPGSDVVPRNEARRRPVEIRRRW
ncbi:MAG: hypothetical protein AAGH88_00735 [Planctomycetota bacterium]